MLGRNIQVALIEPGAIHTGFNQTMLAAKYAWMEQGSYFRDKIPAIKAREDGMFRRIEATNTRAIVANIITASEARRPKLRYVAPWSQALYVRVARMLGV